MKKTGGPSSLQVVVCWLGSQRIAIPWQQVAGVLKDISFDQKDVESLPFMGQDIPLISGYEAFNINAADPTFNDPSCVVILQPSGSRLRRERNHLSAILQEFDVHLETECDRLWAVIVDRTEDEPSPVLVDAHLYLLPPDTRDLSGPLITGLINDGDIPTLLVEFRTPLYQ
ncbi:MAG: hypothetical protein V1846_05400 [Candidatus Komeilibacteria bacterium]